MDKKMKLSILLEVVVLVRMVSAHVKIRSEDMDDKPRGIIFIFVALAIGAFFRSLVKIYNISIPYPIPVLVVGGFVGMLARYFVFFRVYTQVVHTNPGHLLMLLLPVLVFKTALFIDAHTFVRSWLQITLISIPGVIMTASFVGVITSVITSNMTYTMGLLFGTICAPIYPVEIGRLFREIGHSTKHVEILLEGEALMGTSTAIISFYVLLGIFNGNITTWYHIMDVFLRYICGGIFFGYLLGRICSCIIRSVYNDSVNVITATMVFAYVGYYVSEEVLFVSGVISVIGIGVLISIERTSLAADVEMFLLYFWQLLTDIVNIVLFFMIGILIVEYLQDLITRTDYAKIVVSYVLIVIGRFITFTLLAPILSRVGYGLTFANMTVAVWGGLRGVVTFCMALVLYHHPDLKANGHFYVLHVSGVILLTLLLNSTTMRVVLNVLGLSEISLARKANMNNCLKCVSSRRERTISMLKMDKFLSDANWPLVNSATVMKHPYKMSYNDSDDEDETYLVGYRFATCPECKKEVLSEPTGKEFAEMTREARMRILKAKKISYARQYENGLLSKDSIRVLRQAVDTAMDTPAVIVEIEGLQRLFRKENYMQRARRTVLRWFFEKSENLIKPPRKYWRRVCYHIIMRPSFEYFIYLMIVLNTIPITLEMVLAPKTYSTLDISIKILDTYFLLVYLIEFLLKIIGYSWIYICKDGFRTYFSSYWNVFDFTVLLAALADLVLDILDLSSDVFSKSSSTAFKVTATTKLLRIVRLIRLLRLCRAMYPRLLRYCDSRIDSHMAFAYDVGKGFVTGEEEVSEILNQMIDNKLIIQDMKMRMEVDRLAITKELGLIQKHRPWIAITVKTKQAIRSTLNSMFEAIVELKVAGWVDDVEFMKLMEALEDLLKNYRSINSVQPSSPMAMFKEVSWMGDDEETITFLYDHVKTKIFDPGDLVCSDGLQSEGIHIVVTGLLRLKYVPKQEVLEELTEFGSLPVVDFISSTRFDERIEDYIVSGNSFGELSAVTRRPYNCTIVADTPAQVFILTHEVVREAIEKTADSVNGMEASLWKTISIRMALAILMEVPAYQSQSQEKIKYDLERAFVPNTKYYKIFVVNEMMEDVILIQGIVVDFNTHNVYIAPSYIPRTVKRLILPKSSRMNVVTAVETKLLILPTKDVDEYEIMEQEEEISEMVSTASSKCLQHSIQSKISKRRRRKRLMSISSRYHKPRSTPTIGSSKSLYHTVYNNELELQSINMMDDSNSNRLVYENELNENVSSANISKQSNVNASLKASYTTNRSNKPIVHKLNSSKSILKKPSNFNTEPKQHTSNVNILDPKNNTRIKNISHSDLISLQLSAKVDAILQEITDQLHPSVTSFKISKSKSQSLSTSADTTNEQSNDSKNGESKNKNNANKKQK